MLENRQNTIQNTKTPLSTDLCDGKKVVELSFDTAIELERTIEALVKREMIVKVSPLTFAKECLELVICGVKAKQCSIELKNVLQDAFPELSLSETSTILRPGAIKAAAGAMNLTGAIRMDQANKFSVQSSILAYGLMTAVDDIIDRRLPEIVDKIETLTYHFSLIDCPTRNLTGKEYENFSKVLGQFAASHPRKERILGAISQLHTDAIDQICCRVDSSTPFKIGGGTLSVLVSAMIDANPKLDSAISAFGYWIQVFDDALDARADTEGNVATYITTVADPVNEFSRVAHYAIVNLEACLEALSTKQAAKFEVLKLILLREWDCQLAKRRHLQSLVS